MDYLDYEVEDFLLDSSFRNYCLGTNQEDMAFWKQWVVLHPQKYALVQEARQLYRILNGNVGPDDIHLASEKFRTHFESHEATGDTVGVPQASVISLGKPSVGSSGRQFPAKRYWLGAAASIAFVVLTTLLWQRPDSSLSLYPAAGKAIVSNTGERRSFQLPDGTKVILNAGSVLEIPDDFNKNSREITLTGEAFFEVSRDPQKVFLIHTNWTNIKVLGTSFNVKAYKDEMGSETSLLTGSLEVQVKGRNTAVILHPGEKIVVPDQYLSARAKTSPSLDSARPKPAYRIEKMNHNPEDSTLAEVSWIQDKLVFVDDSFAAIAAALQRNYNASILFESEEVKEYRFTASFEKKSLEQILEALAASRPFTFRHGPDNKIIISVANMKN